MYMRYYFVSIIIGLCLCKLTHMQELGFYGDLDTIEVVPVVDGNHGDFDVVGVHNAPMPPDLYHLVSLLEAK